MNGIKFNFNNVLQAFVGEHGIEKQQIDTQKRLIPEILMAVERKRGQLAWRDLPYNQQNILPEIEQTGKYIAENFESFVVLGIGGSALGSKAMFDALCHPYHNQLKNTKIKFYVLDNVDPDGIDGLLDVIDINKTAFHVISKSGNTVETMVQLMLVLSKLKDVKKDAIVVTTNQSSGNLLKIARANGYKTFVVPEGVGGRFSVLCPVGLLSAAVLGLDINNMLKGAAYMDEICKREEENPAMMYALMHYISMEMGVNVSILMPYCNALLSTAEWYGQLWAESLGKMVDNSGNLVHKGQTPVRALGVTDQHSQVQLYNEGPFDKLITFIELENFNTRLEIPQPPIDVYDAGYLAGQTFNKLISSEMEGTRHAVTHAGKLNITITLKELNEFNFGALIYMFEVATAFAGEFLNINAFDQPGVEAGKIATFALMGKEGYEQKAAELRTGKHPDEDFIILT